MKKLLVGLMMSSGLALAGCSSGFSCTSKGPCANDPTPTADETTACQAAQSGTCGSEYTAVGDCGHDNSSCNSAGVSEDTNVSGTLAPDGGLVFTGACASQLTAFFSCCSTNTGAAGCTGT